MELLQHFNEYIKSNNLFSAKDKLLLAVSGGVDSVVLCELCNQAGYDFIIAHCNFQLRGEESERDEKFVRGIAEKYKVEIKVKKFETEKYAEENKLSIQEAARELRYRWFNELTTHDSQLTTFLTAHHADDNAETILMHFCRGTGLHGLTGIPVSQGKIRRPLLSFTKQKLLNFAKEKKLDFVEDSSNLSSKYTRNIFRNEIIPAIAKVYPAIKNNLVDNINRFKEIEKLYRLGVDEIKMKLVKKKGEEWHIPVKQLMGFNNQALIYEIISEFGFSEKQVDEVIKLAESDSGKYIDTPEKQYRIIKHRHWFIISPTDSTVSEIIIIEKNDQTVTFGQTVLQMETTIDQQPSTSPQGLLRSAQTACLDANEISFPLILRKWKRGDYFYPLGMKKKKKLSRFFIDQKLSKTEKEKAWVIEMNKKIIWVVGMRIDERFKMTDKTKDILKITLRHS